MSKPKSITFTYDYDTSTFLDEDPNMTPEERVWDRLKNGIRRKSFDAEMSKIIGDNIKKKIDKDIIEALINEAKKEQK